MNAAISIPKTAPLKTRAVMKVFVDADGEVEDVVAHGGGRKRKQTDRMYLFVYI